MPKPLIVAAFANVMEQSQRLDALDQEYKVLESIFQSNHPVFDLHLIPNAKLEDVFSVLKRPSVQNRIVAFHFSGHAGAERLIFEGQGGDVVTGDGVSLIRFLGTRPVLRFVFLNGCATMPLVDHLFEANIPHIIATRYQVEDQQAAKLSIAFYEEIAQKKAIGPAFNAAVGQVNADQKKQRNFVIKNREEIALSASSHVLQTQLPWGLYSLPLSNPETALLHRKPSTEYPLDLMAFDASPLDQKKHTLKEIVTEDYHESAIKLLFRILKEGSQQESELFQFKARLNLLRKKDEEGMIDHKNLLISLSRYTNDLMNFIKKLKERHLASI